MKKFIKPAVLALVCTMAVQPVLALDVESSADGALNQVNVVQTLDYKISEDTRKQLTEDIKDLVEDVTTKQISSIFEETKKSLANLKIDLADDTLNLLQSYVEVSENSLPTVVGNLSKIAKTKDYEKLLKIAGNLAKSQKMTEAEKDIYYSYLLDQVQKYIKENKLTKEQFAQLNIDEDMKQGLVEMIRSVKKTRNRGTNN